MLIRCDNCHELFDYQECKGVCPACEHRQEPPVSFSPTGPAAAAAAAKSHGHKLPLLLLILWAAILLAFFVGRQIGEARWKRSGKLDGEVPTTQVQAKEFSFRGRSASAGPCEKLGSGYTTSLEEGHQLVRVSFSIEKPMDFEPGLSDTLFLQVFGPEGTAYYAPARSYDVEHIYPELTEKLLDDYCLHTYEEVDGDLYFVIPKDATDPVLYIELARTPEFHNTPRTVEQALICPLKLVDASAESEVAEDA